AYLLRYLLVAVPIAAVFLAYNYSVYHALLSPYYRTPLDGVRPHNWAKLGGALAANLISPSRGLLIYTPICLFALWSMERGKWRTPLAPWLTALAILHWFVISSHTINWWAGHCYRPRFFTDLTPVFVLFLIPYVEHWNSFAR